MLLFGNPTKFIYANTADFDINEGYLAATALELNPGGLDSGFILGISGQYFNQIPKSYNEHYSFEFLGYAGYRF